MSVLKKGLIFLLLGITVLVAWLLFVPNEQPALNFSSKNKIELLARILDHRNANTIRKAGYGIPSANSIKSLCKKNGARAKAVTSYGYLKKNEVP